MSELRERLEATIHPEHTWSPKRIVEPMLPIIEAELNEKLAAKDREIAELQAALGSLDKDPHMFSKRPCRTCLEVTLAIKRPFGCNRLARELAR